MALDTVMSCKNAEKEKPTEDKVIMCLQYYLETTKSSVLRWYREEHIYVINKRYLQFIYI
jgi:hypothetical protein